MRGIRTGFLTGDEKSHDDDDGGRSSPLSSGRNFVIWGCVAAAGWWLLETSIHTWVFRQGTFTQMLLCRHDTNELWMRLLGAALVIALGFAGQIAKRNAIALVRRNMEVNRLTRFVQGVEASLAARMPHGGAQASGSAVGHEGHGNVSWDAVDEAADPVERMGAALEVLKHSLDMRFHEINALLHLTEQSSAGLVLDDVLDRCYETFRPIIPFDRIGVALLERNETIVRAIWSRSDGIEEALPRGYKASLDQTSLGSVLASGQPRIIDDLEAHLRRRPRSDSTRRLVGVGFRSSLTCPLLARGRALGFMFFTSTRVGAYRNAHSEVFKLVAGHMAAVLDRTRIFERLAHQQERTRALLHNVVPAPVAVRLEAGERPIADELPDISVMFVDIVHFCELTNCMTPATLAELLTDLFTTFDMLCDRYGVEKIKTIGDAYMVITGGPESSAAGPRELAEFALACRKAVADMRLPNGQDLRVRMGMHCGPAIGGVIGQRKFAYDVWGATVNLASRLESLAEADHILVSEAIMKRLGRHYRFEPHGEVPARGLGMVQTWYLTGRVGEVPEVGPARRGQENEGGPTATK